MGSHRATSSPRSSKSTSAPRPRRTSIPGSSPSRRSCRKPPAARFSEPSCARSSLITMSTRPAVAICTKLTQAKWSVWDRPAALVPLNYIAAAQRAGALTVLIPPDAALEHGPDEALELIDGLILAGGADIDPSTYGAQPHPMTGAAEPERDRTEIALTRRAVERDMPVLGICRGMQLINVAFGGTLRQHLPDEVGHEEHRRFPGSFDGADHDVRLKAGSLAAMAAG